MQATGLCQTSTPFPRACGAIALVDVLTRLGVKTDIRSVWPHVAMPDPFGTWSAKSYRLARQARDLGFRAGVLQCHRERAWDALVRCARLGVAVIINHQAMAARHEGHFSTLVSISEEVIVLDDPILRSQIQIPRKHFLNHWSPNDEITGHVLIAIGGRSKINSTGSAPQCPRCKTALSLQPSELFTAQDWNHDGLWDRFFCVECDASFSPRN